MADINQNISRFHGNGTLTIIDGTTDVILNVLKATVRYTHALQRTIDISEGDVPSTPLRGQWERGTIEFEARYTSDFATAEIEQRLLADRSSPTGQKKVVTFVIDLTDFGGSTLSKKLTFANTTTERISVSSGDDFDTISYAGRGHNAGAWPVIAAS